jgi:CRISPR-associated protein Cmr1
MYTKLEFELEFITPAFIGEAFPEKETDLRPASLIGSLRYWFRQLLGTLTDDVEKIYNLESALFGNQNRAGLVRVRVEPTKEVFVENRQTGELSDLAYIGYGNLVYNKSFKRFVNAKPYLKPGSKYRLTFLVPKNLEQLFLSFLYLYNFLGSLGGRNRRGWGNFVLKPLTSLCGKAKNYNWKKFNKELLNDTFKEFKNSLIKLKIPLTGRLWKLEIHLSSIIKNDSKRILEELALLYRNFRSKRRPDYSNFRNFLIFGKNYKYSQLVYNRSWFGLPINIQYRNLRGKKGFINLFFGKSQTRLASPIIFRVVKTEKGYSLLILVKEIPKVVKPAGGFFYKWDIPHNGEVKAKAGNAEREVVANQPFNDFIKLFLQETFGVNNPLLTLP